MWKNPARNFVGCAVAVERAVVGDHVDAQTGDLAVLGTDLAVHDVVARKAGREEVLGRFSTHLTGTPATIEAGDQRT